MRLTPGSSTPGPSRPRRKQYAGLLCLALGLTQGVERVVAAGKAGTFVLVGESGVSAQQLFLGNAGHVYIVDKTEGNPAQVNGHSAWATEYDLSTNTYRTMDIRSNSFCAGGTVLGNGTWLHVGGNNAITWGGAVAPTQDTAAAPYGNVDGGKALRLLNPCTDKTCQWVDNPAMYLTTRRWYPTLETLEDGSAIIIGGCLWGGYVNSADQNNPTYEFWPNTDGAEPITMNILLNTMPVNLFPLTWLLPSGNLFIQSNRAAMIFDYKNAIEYNIADIPSAVRVYPASGATAVYPMTPNNNWTSTIIFCGGTNLASNQWVTTWPIVQYAADATCVTISPDVDLTWYTDDPLDTGRTMGQFINLPDGRLLMLNGGHLGTAGYGTDAWAIGQSYADQPLHTAWYFDHTQASGNRWSQAGTSNIDRLYHSSATLLLDGSVFVSGSNPNADYVSKANNATYTYVTQYEVEIFYPSYYDETRPIASGWPANIRYGGAYFNMTISLASLSNEPMNILKTKVVIIRTGFSTHSMNMGQRHVELRTSFTTAEDGSAVLHVSQLPGNPAILVPGPAAIFLVINGVPSLGQMIMVGSGEIETQPIAADATLPPNTMPENPTWTKRKSAQDEKRAGGRYGRTD